MFSRTLPRRRDETASATPVHRVRGHPSIRRALRRQAEPCPRASRCFSFWVLARKEQLRAALNEAGSHPINGLVW